MKTKSTIGYVLRLALTLLVITGVVAVLLSLVNSVTAKRIAAFKEQKTQQAILTVLPSAETITTLPVADGNPEIKAVYQSGTSYAVEVVSAGFGGEIDMMVGVSNDGKVLGVSIISHTETAGLGAVAAAQNTNGQKFRDQFVGLGGTLAVTKDGGTVEALTGATITSRAVTSGINAALTYVAALA